MTIRDVMGGGNAGVTAAGTTISFSLPATAAVGDRAIVFIASSFPASATLTSVSQTGWSYLNPSGAMDTANAGLGTFLQSKVLNSTDITVGTVTFTLGASGRIVGAGIVLVGDATPSFGTPVWTHLSGQGTLAYGSVTTTVANTDVLEFSAWGGAARSTGDTMPGTKDDENDTAYTSGNQYAAAIAHLTPGAAGTYGGGNFSPVADSAISSYIVAVNPGSSVISPTVFRIDSGGTLTAVNISTL